MSPRAASQKCKHEYADGQPCRAWAVRGSEPPRCAAHAGRVGAPPGNQNARRHGFYARTSSPADCTIQGIDAAIADLERRITQVAKFLETCEEPETMLRAFTVYAQAMSRYGRLLRDQRALSGKSADGLLDAIGKALDEINTELGTKL